MKSSIPRLPTAFCQSLNTRRLACTENGVVDFQIYGYGLNQLNQVKVSTTEKKAKESKFKKSTV
jgi:hypothetical protein